MSPYLKQRLGNKLREISLSQNLERTAVRLTVESLSHGNVQELSSKFRLIEFEKRKKLSDLDPASFKDVYGYIDDTGRTRRGIAHKIFNSAEFGGRAAADLIDYASRRRAASESARVGKFKLTENSPNTARITVGPDQRERRKKYVWERVGVQRQAAILGGAALFTGGMVLKGKIRDAGGIKNVLGKAVNAGQRLKSNLTGGPKIKPFVPAETPEAKVGRLAQSYAAGVKSREATDKLKYPHGYTMEKVPDLHPADHPTTPNQQKVDEKGNPKFKRRRKANAPPSTLHVVPEQPGATG